MKKILLFMIAGVMAVFLAAGCADDSEKSTETGSSFIEGLYYVDSISSSGYSIPQDNVTVRSNSQDYQNAFAVIDGINFTPDIPEEALTLIMYGEKRSAFNIRYENGKYIFPIVVNTGGETHELDLVMTKIAGYPVNTGIGNLRDIFKITANNGDNVSTNSGTINFNAEIETNSTASDFDFALFNASLLSNGLYAAYALTPMDSMSYTFTAKDNNTYQYSINVGNAEDIDAAYLLLASEKNVTNEPNNLSITIVKPSKSETQPN